MKMIDSGPQKVKQNIPTKLGFHSHIYLAIYIKKSVKKIILQKSSI